MNEPPSDTPPSELDSGELFQGESAASPSEDSIGPYKLLEIIGEGGMGIVYRAEQREPVRRPVALKVIKLGMDTREILSRFEAEQQTLAVLDHPAIAKLYDAGATEDGRPYFAMELVAGQPITAYCDRHKLDLRERLELFVGLCRGLEHAHRRGILHRDIKPSNVLVTNPDGKPLAKIIDFGVAKAINQRLTEKTLYTQIGRVIGTPAYMSPEQAAPTAEGIDHRTDIYALGALLYELLTGQLPLELDVGSVAFDEIARQVREVDPPTPSTRWSHLNPARTASLAKRRNAPHNEIARNLRGELDWITMKALEKEPHRRYESAAMLAADIERFLHREAVLAGPPSSLYRLRRYIQRNRGPVLAASAVIAALSLGLTVSLLQRAEAQRATREAEALARRTNEVISESFAVLTSSEELLQSTPGAQEIRVALLVRARDYYESLAEKGHRDEALLGSIHEELGSLYRELGQLSLALQSHERARVIREDLLKEAPEDPTRVRDVATTLNSVAYLQRRAGQSDVARQHFGRAKDLQESLVDDSEETEESRENRRLLARTYHNAGADQAQAGDGTAALASYEKALPIREELARSDPRNASLGLDLGLTLMAMADARQTRREFEEAQRLIARGLGILEPIAADHPDDADVQLRLASSYGERAELMGRLGRTPEAIEDYQKAGLIFRKLLRENPSVVTYAVRSAQNDRNLAMLDPAQSVASLDRALGILEPVVEQQPTHAEAQLELAMVLNNLGVAYKRSGELPQALKAYQRSLEIREQLVAQQPGQDRIRADLAQSYNNLAALHLEMKAPSKALEAVRQAIAIREDLVSANDRSPSHRHDLGISLVVLATYYLEVDDTDSKLATLDRAGEIYEDLTRDYPSVRLYKTWLSECARLRAASKN